MSYGVRPRTKHDSSTRILTAVAGEPATLLLSSGRLGRVRIFGVWLIRVTHYNSDRGAIKRQGHYHGAGNTCHKLWPFGRSVLRIFPSMANDVEPAWIADGELWGHAAGVVCLNTRREQVKTGILDHIAMNRGC